MCGIAGIYHFKHPKPIEPGLLKAMGQTLFHRGPDDEGYFQEAGLGFAFRRLAIIDLTTGNQPMFNQDRSIVLVCNGEIYNYRELRAELLGKGYRFRTNCDVEVLVHLYEAYGPDFVKRLNGQFAFAIFDKNKQRLMLARDQAGIAPLFYTLVDDTLLFGSEIKALLQHPAVKREVDLVALDQMLTFPSVPSPRTMFAGVNALRPGHMLLLEAGVVKEKVYWSLDFPEQKALPEGKAEAYYIERLDELLHQAVRYRLNADVPVGFYLSGGLDSSLIAALIRANSKEERHSFSIGFEEDELDERQYQRLMVDAVGSQHHEVIFRDADVVSRLKQVVHFAEAPVKETYNACSLALSQSVREQDIKVVLTGEGADELFGGYVGYRFDMLGQRQETLEGAAVALERQMRKKLWGDPHFRYERDLYELKEIKAALYSQQLHQNYKKFNCTKHPLVNRDRLLGRHPIHMRTMLDFRLRLSDHLIADHGDRVAYANSIEARYPFLDVDVMNFVTSIPPGLLVNGGTEKYVLKKLAARYLPPRIAKREKFGFVAQGSHYLLKNDIEWVNDYLSYERIKRQGFFNPDTVERLKTMYRGEHFSLNQTFETDFLMIVLTFGIFTDMFNLPSYG